VGNEEYKKLINLGGADAGWVGEMDQRTATNTSKLKQIAPIFGELYANPMATQKSLDDMFFDVEKWLAEEVGEVFAEKESHAALLGDGQNKMKGLLAHTLALTDDATRAFDQIQKFHSGNVGSFSPDDLITLVYGLKKGYRKGAKFMLNSNTLAATRKFKDGQGNYIWQPSMIAGQPSLLMGQGIAENEDMPDIAADSNAVAFGNFKRAYTIVDRIGTRMLRDPYTNKPYVGFYTTKRVGGMLNDSKAVKVLTLSN
jgi:HK97 family phage major capsid protein